MKSEPLGADPGMTPRSSGEWWADELLALRGAMTRSLRRKGLGDQSDEVVDAIAAELTEMLRAPGHRWPASWSAAVAPPPADAEAFHALAWRMTRLRGLDAVRQSYVRTAALEQLRDEPKTETGDGREARMAARRVLRMIAARLDAMPPEDRDLLMNGADDAGGDAASGRDRTRLHRLRKRLADELRGELEE